MGDNVVITVTAEGWKTEITLGGKQYTESHTKTSSGSTGKSVFEEEEAIPEKLFYAIEMCGMPYEIMKALSDGE